MALATYGQRLLSGACRDTSPLLQLMALCLCRHLGSGPTIASQFLQPFMLRAAFISVLLVPVCWPNSQRASLDFCHLMHQTATVFTTTSAGNHCTYMKMTDGAMLIPSFYGMYVYRVYLCYVCIQGILIPRVPPVDQAIDWYVLFRLCRSVYPSHSLLGRQSSQGSAS